LLGDLACLEDQASSTHLHGNLEGCWKVAIFWHVGFLWSRLWRHPGRTVRPVGFCFHCEWKFESSREASFPSNPHRVTPRDKSPVFQPNARFQTFFAWNLYCVRCLRLTVLQTATCAG